MLYEEVLEVECRVVPYQDNDLLFKNVNGDCENLPGRIDIFNFLFH